jgi:hypothetical protein
MANKARTLWDVVRKSFGDARHDMHRLFPRPKHWISFFVLTIAFLFLMVSYYPMIYFWRPPDNGACPLGDFTLRPDLESPFTAAGFLQITFSFGRMSFGQAKLVDIVWDIVCFPLFGTID